MSLANDIVSRYDCRHRSQYTKKRTGPCYKVGMTTEKPRVEPLDPPMVPFAVAGLAGFVIAGLIVLLAHGPRHWLWICVAGFLCGIPGLITMLRHDAHRRRRRALTHPEFHETV
jgi:Protein of unknown function (DUF2530)